MRQCLEGISQIIKMSHAKLHGFSNGRWFVTNLFLGYSTNRTKSSTNRMLGRIGSSF